MEISTKLGAFSKNESVAKGLNRDNRPYLKTSYLWPVPVFNRHLECLVNACTSLIESCVLEAYRIILRRGCTMKLSKK